VRSTNELSELTHGTVSAWTLQNLESGRRHDLNVTSLLNVAMALRVAPGYLLAPMGRPHDYPDLVGLVEPFESMTIAEFDAWFSGLPEGVARSPSSDDRNERNELQALREVMTLSPERRRLLTMATLESRIVGNSDAPMTAPPKTTSKRLTETERHISELTDYLTAAGWDMSSWTQRDG